MAVIDNLISYWSLDEASGDAIDAHSTNDATETNGPIAAVAGLVSGARDLEAGSSQYFTRASNGDLQVGDLDFTVQAWVNIEDLATFRFFLSKDDGGSNREYSFGYDSSANRFTFGVSVNGSAFAIFQNANTFGAPSVATWYLVHGWHDSVNDVVGISVNAGTPDTSAHTTGVFVGAGPLNLGSLSHVATLTMDGLLDEMAFWKKVLTAGERTWLYNGGAGRSYADIVAEAGGGQSFFVLTRF